MNIADWVTASATIAAAVAALASWRAAVRSSDTAIELASIERDRRLAELQPLLSARIVRHDNGACALNWTLEGPPALLTLDSVTIRTRGDGLDWTSRTTQENRDRIGEFTWGPAQFRLGIDGSVSKTESAELRDVEQGTEVSISVEASTAPPWWSQEDWAERYRKQPMRLAVACQRGEDRWTVHLNVPASKVYPSAGLVTG